VVLEPVAERDDRLASFRTGVVLAEVFPRPAERTPRGAPRFALAAVRGGEGGTTAVLAVDAWSGRLALLRSLEVRSRLAASLLPQDFRPLLGAAAEGRGLAAVPRVSGLGRTVGVWLLAGPRLGAALVTDPDSPADLDLARVELRP